MSFDLIVRNATLPDGRTGIDIAVRGRPHRGGRAGDRRRRPAQTVDAGGHLVSPPFVDAHFHMDATLSLRPAAPQRVRHAARRHRAVGRAEAAAHARGGGRARAAPIATGRWRRACSRSAAMSTSATTGLLAVEALLEVKRASRPISTCSSSPSRRTATTARRAPPRTSKRALDLGVDVVGGIPHFERTMADGAALGARRCARSRPSAACWSTCIATRPTTRCRATSRRWPSRRSGSACRAASPARTSPRCTRWTTTTSRSCCR